MLEHPICAVHVATQEQANAIIHNAPNYSIWVYSHLAYSSSDDSTYFHALPSEFHLDSMSYIVLDMPLSDISGNVLHLPRLRNESQTFRPPLKAERSRARLHWLLFSRPFSPPPRESGRCLSCHILNNSHRQESKILLMQPIKAKSATYPKTIRHGWDRTKSYPGG